jgi:hypothetical protein
MWFRQAGIIRLTLWNFRAPHFFSLRTRNGLDIRVFKGVPWDYRQVFVIDEGRF